MTKDKKNLSSIQYPRFNDVQIEFDLEDFILTKKSHIGDILLVYYATDFISLKGMNKKKLSFQKEYLA